MTAKKTRYQRQIILPQIGEDGQARLAKAKVLCVGAGGLGSPALLYLAAAGVGTLGICDFDKVDESNLQRQILHDTPSVGMDKTESARKRLHDINPNISLEIFPAGLNADNVIDLFQTYDLILDGTDNFSTKYLINDAAVKCGKPVVYGAIQGFDGLASVFDSTRGPCYRCLYPAPPKAHVLNCAEAGVIGPVAGIIGTVQALEAIKLIVAHPDFQPLIGRLWRLDMMTMSSQILEIAKNPKCPVCAKDKGDIPLSYASPVCGYIPEITPEQARKTDRAIFIDVREQEEWDAGHIEGAIHFALSRLSQGEEPEDLLGKYHIILYCQRGFRSMKAAQILRALGYTDISSLSGGIEAWHK